MKKKKKRALIIRTERCFSARPLDKLLHYFRVINGQKEKKVAYSLQRIFCVPLTFFAVPISTEQQINVFIRNIVDAEIQENITPFNSLYILARFLQIFRTKSRFFSRQHRHLGTEFKQIYFDLMFRKTSITKYFQSVLETSRLILLEHPLYPVNPNATICNSLYVIEPTKITKSV